MEKYFTQTQGLLGIVQAVMSSTEMERSQKASIEMWEEIRKITEKHQLNVHEMLNATLACTSSILEVVMEQVEEKKGE